MITITARAKCWVMGADLALLVVLAHLNRLAGAEGGAADALRRGSILETMGAGVTEPLANGWQAACRSLRLGDGLVHAARRMRQAADVCAVHRQIHRLQFDVRLQEELLRRDRHLQHLRQRGRVFRDNPGGEREQVGVQLLAEQRVEIKITRCKIAGLL